MSKKPIIVFEGIEGSGKSHHISVISRYLDKKKISYIKIREPGGNPNSEKIRKLILNNKSNFNNNTDLLLYMAARSENIDLIKKFNKKKIILIDRFIYSTLAYQHYGFGINKNLIESLNKHLLNDIKPDHIFFHTVSGVNLKKRLKNRKVSNRYDKFNFLFYNKVQNGFKKIFKNKKNVTLINSDKLLIYNKNTVLKKLQKLIND